MLVFKVIITVKNDNISFCAFNNLAFAILKLQNKFGCILESERWCQYLIMKENYVCEEKNTFYDVKTCILNVIQFLHFSIFDKGF